MLPLMLDLARLRLMLIGNGTMALRRLRLLEEAGAVALVVHADAPDDELVAAAGDRLRRTLPSPVEIAAAQLIFIADPAPDDTLRLAAAARGAGILVHVEDSPALTDAHAPAVLRRGDLTIAISTGGASPALARQVKQFLAGLFGPEWQGHLVHLAGLRRRWRADGANSASVTQLTEDLVTKAGWLRPAHPLPTLTTTAEDKADGKPITPSSRH